MSSLRWEGTALVVTWQTQRSDGEMKISFRYELVDGGRRLQAMEQVRGTDHDQDNVWIFSDAESWLHGWDTAMVVPD